MRPKTSFGVFRAWKNTPDRVGTKYLSFSGSLGHRRRRHRCSASVPPAPMAQATAERKLRCLVAEDPKSKKDGLVIAGCRRVRYTFNLHGLSSHVIRASDRVNESRLRTYVRYFYCIDVTYDCFRACSVTHFNKNIVSCAGWRRSANSDFVFL